MFARRAGWDLAPNELARRAESLRAAGGLRVDLSESIPARCGLRAAGERLAQLLVELAGDARVADYAPDARGELAARRAIAHYCAERGIGLEPEALLLTAGTSEAYAHLFRLLADPGERVLVPRPSYPLFDFIAELEGLEVVPYPLALARPPATPAWRIDVAAVRTLAADGVRALIVVHPNNPTGSLVHPDDLAALRALCAERGLALIVDEVFADYLFDPAARAASPLAAPGADPLGFALSGASKVLGLPQLKLAWIACAGPPALRDEALARLEVIADTYLSVSPLAQRALPRLLAERRSLQAPILGRVRANRAELTRRLAAAGTLELLPADGGWSAVLRGALDDERCAHALLERHGVLVHPGYLFDLPPGHLVVSLLPEPAAFRAGIDALLESLAAA